jgi:hypothetical protein
MATSVQPRVVNGAASAPYRPVLRLGTTVLVAGLLVQVVLGAANVAFVDVGHEEPTARWLLELHAGTGTLLLLLSIALLVGAVRSRERRWVVSAGLGLAGLVTAFAAGDTFAHPDGPEWASFVMATGCAVALAAYVRLLVVTRGTR